MSIDILFLDIILVLGKKDLFCFNFLRSSHKLVINIIFSHDKHLVMQKHTASATYVFFRTNTYVYTYYYILKPCVCRYWMFSLRIEKQKRFRTHGKKDKSKWKRILCISTFQDALLNTMMSLEVATERLKWNFLFFIRQAIDEIRKVKNPCYNTMWLGKYNSTLQECQHTVKNITQCIEKKNLI